MFLFLFSVIVCLYIFLCVCGVFLVSVDFKCFLFCVFFVVAFHKWIKTLKHYIDPLGMIGFFERYAECMDHRIVLYRTIS